MESKTCKETNGCTFKWQIENISLGLLRPRYLKSPDFTAVSLEGTKWSLRLTQFVSSGNGVDVLLKRKADCTGPESIQVNYHIAFLDKNGKPLTKKSSTVDIFGKDDRKFITFEDREKFSVAKQETFFPEDLTVRCILWKNKDTLIRSEHVSARTVLKVNRRSFVWEIDDFSSLKHAVRSKFKDDFIDLDLVLNGELDFGKKLALEIISVDYDIKYFSFKIAVINSEGDSEYCGNHEYFDTDIKKGILATLPFPKMLLENQNRYLPNDRLTLDFEYIYSTGTVSHQICGNGTISPKLTTIALEKRKEHWMEQSSSQLMPELAIDMKYMYNDGIFSDMELRTSTQTFRVHKNILSARSPVFRRMFSNDMKEKNSGHVDITDFEDDTVHRMLLYMYTDSLENLQLESALKLYAIADKYEILSLRSRCSSFLKNNLCSNKACDVLAVADLYQDVELKSAVENYILKHDKEVFGSQEWKHFMSTNSKLAADAMFRKVLLG